MNHIKIGILLLTAFGVWLCFLFEPMETCAIESGHNTGGKEKIYYYINDHLGTPQRIIDEHNKIVWSADYRPFGQADIMREVIQNPFRLPGQYYDRESGLHYNYHRYYNPATGRYSTPDPIGLAGMDPNLYDYVRNNPINFMDPIGLWTFQIGIGFNFGAGIGTSKSIGIAISKKPHTSEWQIGGYGTIGAGVHVGATGDLTLDLIFSENDCIGQLAGPALTIGGSIATPVIGPHIEIGSEVNSPLIENAKHSINISPGIGVGTPAEGHALITNTFIWHWGALK